MLIGLLFIISGILIFAYPQILAFITAVFLFSVGFSLIVMHFHFRRVVRNSDNPFFNFFIRF
ncbi:MAG: DUF3096 domain-containing protein [Candidatus Omnitrophica bacterium]|nr:DUF3096 domain-containing protein [Candidatus Omnitrophota bacterium]